MTTVTPPPTRCCGALPEAVPLERRRAVCRPSARRLRPHRSPEGQAAFQWRSGQGELPMRWADQRAQPTAGALSPSAVSAGSEVSPWARRRHVSTQLPISARQSSLARPPHPLLPSKLQLHPEIPGGIKMAGWIPAHTGAHTAASDGMLGPEIADCAHQQTCSKQALPVNRAGCPWSLPMAFRQRLAPAGPGLAQAPHRVLSRAAPGPGQAGAAVWGLSSCSQQLRASMSHFSEALGPWRRSSRMWRPYSPHHVNGLSSQHPPERAAMGRWAVSLSSLMRARRLTPEN